MLRNSPEPLVTLLGVSNHYKNDTKITADPIEVAKLKLLPLRHGTTIEGLMTMARHGEMLSHREACKQKLIDLHDGNTLEEDKMLGLDTQVFLDFGRPSCLQKDKHPVNIVISAEALNTPGAFVTTNDYLNYVAATGISEGRVMELEQEQRTEYVQTVRMRQNRKYIDDVSIVPYCFEAIARHFAENEVSADAFARGDGDLDPKSLCVGGKEGMGFISPEVKIPRVPISMFEAIEFRDSEDMAVFCESFPQMAGLCRLMVAPSGKLIETSAETDLEVMAEIKKANEFPLKYEVLLPTGEVLTGEITKKNRKATTRTSA